MLLFVYDTTICLIFFQCDFHSEVKAILKEVLSQHKMSSVVHKMVANCQKEYMLEVDTLFPWLEEQKVEEAGLPMAMEVSSVDITLPVAGGTRAPKSFPCGIEVPAM